MAETQRLPSFQQLHSNPPSQHAFSPMQHRDHASSLPPSQSQPLQHLSSPANASAPGIHAHQSQHQATSSLIQPPVNAPPSQPYPPNGHPPINGVGNGHHRVLYPIPPQSGMEMRPPKREIKRRTKTGCMTCRKRRIKCDEGHPCCRNCQKSKRECLGYDPIFKPQGPNAAQAREESSSGPTLQHPEARLSHTNGPTSLYPPLQTQPYLPPTSNHQNATAAPSQPLSAIQEYAGRTGPPSPDTTVDPALNSTESGAMSAPISAILSPDHSSPGATEMRQTRKGTRIHIDDLFLAPGAPTEAMPKSDRSATPPAEDELREIQALYMTHYAPALNTFFETAWYTNIGGAFLLHREKDTAFYRHCAQAFKSRAPDPTLETRLIWLYACLPRLAWEVQKAATPELADLLHRVDVVERLVTGSILPVNLIPPAPLTPKNPPPNAVPTPEFISHSFWHHLGHFCAQDDTSPDFTPSSPACHNMTSSMIAMRQLLSVLENRDVLFSIAIARHFGGRLELFDEKKMPVGRTQDPEEPQNKFGVAWAFLTREEVDGTTGVVRGIAAMGRRGVLLHHAEETRPKTADSR